MTKKRRKNKNRQETAIGKVYPVIALNQKRNGNNRANNYLALNALDGFQFNRSYNKNKVTVVAPPNWEGKAIDLINDNQTLIIRLKYKPGTDRPLETEELEITVTNEDTGAEAPSEPIPVEPVSQPTFEA